MTEDDADRARFLEKVTRLEGKNELLDLVRHLVSWRTLRSDELAELDSIIDETLDEFGCVFNTTATITLLPALIRRAVREKNAADLFGVRHPRR